MARKINDPQDAFRALRLDMERDRLVQMARHGTNTDEPEIFETYTRTRARQGTMKVTMALTLIALAAVAGAVLSQI